MMKRTRAAVLFILVTFFAAAQVPPTDKNADPFKGLAAAKERASKENKRILVMVGGEWCEWCSRLDNFINSDRELLDLLKRNFVVLKVHTEKDLSPNGLFLSKYQTPPGFPHVYVLNEKGELLESKRTDVLEAGESYDKQKVKDFLAYWTIKK